MATIYKNIDDIPYKFLHDVLIEVSKKQKVLRVKMFKDGSADITFLGKLSKVIIKSILRKLTPKGINVPQKLRDKPDCSGIIDYYYNFFESYLDLGNVKETTHIITLYDVEYRDLVAEYNNIKDIKEPFLKSSVDKISKLYSIDKLRIYPDGHIQMTFKGILDKKDIRKVIKYTTPKDMFPEGFKIIYGRHYTFGKYADNTPMTRTWSIENIDYIKL